MPYPDQASQCICDCSGCLPFLIPRTEWFLVRHGIEHLWATGRWFQCSTINSVHIADNVLSMATGANHSLFLEQNGSLYGMGLNSSGQLGDGSITNRSSPVHIVDNVLSMAAGHNHSLIMKKDGSLWMVGYNSNGQIGDGKSSQYAISKINTFGNLNQTATGVNHTLFLQQEWHFVWPG